MNAPEIMCDEESHHFLVSPQHTCDLIKFLRQHLDGFSVDVSGIQVEFNDDADMFEVPLDNSREVLGGLLHTFFTSR